MLNQLCFLKPSCRAGNYFFPQKVIKNSSLKNFARSLFLIANAKFCKATFVGTTSVPYLFYFH